ncbi:glycosyl hydrolase family 18 protein [Serratia marcescens]|uniref:glycosyl hydrolase family 18 protein n=1 Tax=Serratia marcescens TaxID=615 RepID=UPI00237EF66B|nr:glycosyl hydrolase family 18 protein [Serratia marcescens]
MMSHTNVVMFMMKIYDDMRKAMIEHNGFKIGFKSKALATLSLGASLFASMPFSVLAAHPTISAYYLSGQDEYSSLDNLKKLSDNIASNKASFNTIVISFAHPSFTNYRPGSLACSGLFGYMCAVGEKGQVDNNKIDKQQAVKDFKQLKSIIKDLKESGISTYIAVGGWNFSCRPDIYDATSGRGKNSCGPEGAIYDSFPNPMPLSAIPRPKFENSLTDDDARKAYKNLVALANELGASGIDVDYEEFWHADINAKEWQLTPDTAVTKSDEFMATISNAGLMEKGGIDQSGKKGKDVFDGDIGDIKVIAEKIYAWDDKDHKGPMIEKYPRAMPLTVEKYNAILETLFNFIKESNSSLKVSTAGPAVGAIPNMAANYGTTVEHSDTVGGAWWGGNLYGLIYNTALLHPKTIDQLSYIGVMSYDLSADEKNCGQKAGNIPCVLANQVEYYYSQYINWLKSGNQNATENLIMTIIKGEGKEDYQKHILIQPKRLMVKPPILIGFEVGNPAVGNLLLTKKGIDNVVDQTAQYSPSGMIMWDLFKNVRYDKDVKTWQADWATPDYVLKTVCAKFGLVGDKYDCDSAVTSGKKDAAVINKQDPNETNSNDSNKAPTGYSKKSGDPWYSDIEYEYRDRVTWNGDSYRYSLQNEKKAGIEPGKPGSEDVWHKLDR